MRQPSARAWISKHVPLAEQPRQWSAKPHRRVRLPHGTPAFARWATARQAISSSIGVERYTLMAVRKDLPNRNRGRATLMPVHFPSESGLPPETRHGRSCCRTATVPGARFSALGIPFHATRNPGAGQGFTDLAAAVQLRLRVALGLQTLAVKSRLLPGENTVRIRGGPPISMLP